ncbi:hypothetical protein ACSFBI_33510 [Variovorax sp. RB3P1]
MYIKPIVQLGILHSGRTGREDKFGGLAFGFPPERWPKCAVCGRSQNFIAHFHHSEHVKLGRAGRALYLFQCPDGAVCGDWDFRTGANAAILVEESEQSATSTPSPEDAQVEPEGVVIGWEEIEPSQWTSYVGPSPTFGDFHDVAARPTGRFLLQLVGTLEPTGPVPSVAETGAEHLHYWGGDYGQDNMRTEPPPNDRFHYGHWSRGQSNHPGRPSQVVVRESGEWSIEWANFGEGTAYVYIDDEAGAAFFFSER